jgi:hypothetical protein
MSSSLIGLAIGYLIDGSSLVEMKTFHVLHMGHAPHKMLDK